MSLDQLEQMTDRITGNLMTHLSNRLYFDYQETSDETAAFNEFMLQHIQPVLKAASEAYIQQRQLEAEQKDYQTKLDDISKLLQRWRAERRLSKEAQKAGILGNVLEEITELARAKTIDDKIDALCDICVFAINASNADLAYEHTTAYDLLDENAIFKFVCIAMQDVQYDRLSRLICRCFASIKQLGYNPFEAMHETIKEISSRTGEWDEKLGKFVKDCGVYGDEQSLLEFESNYRALYPDNNIVFEYRDNEVDVNIDYGKSIYTYKLWYKANYSKCKEK